MLRAPPPAGLSWFSGAFEQDVQRPARVGERGAAGGSLGGGIPATQAGRRSGSYCHSPERRRAMRSAIGGWVEPIRTEKLDFCPANGLAM